jgi:hypothetical protein
MAERKQRSDAQQNRERILVVAKEAFAKSGANAASTTSQNRPVLGLERSTAIFPRGRTF